METIGWCKSLTLPDYRAVTPLAVLHVNRKENPVDVSLFIT
jgi:hypothetical protein